MQEKGDKGRKYTHTHTILTMAVVWADNKEGKKEEEKEEKKALSAGSRRTNE